MWPAGLTGALVLVALAADLSSFAPTLPPEAIAATLVVLAQVQAERWVRHRERIRLTLAAAFVTLATILHASLSTNSVRKAYDFASGMTALIGLGSLVVVIPEYLRGRIPSRAHKALLRGLLIGVGGAVFYFERHF